MSVHGTWRTGWVLAGLGLLAGAAAAETGPANPREAYRALNALRVDRTQIYYARELRLRRDAIRIVLEEGKLAFFTAFEGRVTGAVFTGSGRVLAMPRDPVEKASLARFLGAPLLDQPFAGAYLRFTDDTAEELLAQLRAAGARPTDDPAFADQWDATLDNLNPGHSLHILTDLLSSAPRPYFYAGLAGTAAGPFDVLVDNRRDEQILIGRWQWAGDIRSYDVWASFPRSDAPRMPRASGATFRPVSYEIETTIEPELTLESRAALALDALCDGERMLPLELSRFLRAESVTDTAGQPLVFFQNEAMNRKEIAERGNDSLFVVLPRASRSGEAVRLRVNSRGSVISDAGNGVYFVGERGSWYPHPEMPASFAKFDLTFRWPRRLLLAATGKRMEEHEEGDWRIGRWHSEVPVPVAGFNVGEYATSTLDAGRFRIELYANKQLEEALLRRLQPTRNAPAALPTSPIWPRRSTGRVPAALPLPEPPPPSPAALLKQLGQEIADCIRFYEKLLGPFPFEQIAISPIPGMFGQGWPELVYLSTLSFLPPAAQQRAGLGTRTQEQFTELLPFHEAAHQWWGNSVGSQTYHDQWIHEALANYLCLLYANSKRPGEKPLTTWLERFRKDLTTKKPGENEAPERAGPLTLGTRLRSSKSPGAYEKIVYGKGPWVFHMLRMMLRDPAKNNPDAAFAQLLRSLMENYRYAGLTNEDLQRAVEKVMTSAMDLEGNGKMEWFFDQWVRGTGIPQYTLTFEVRPRGNAFLVRGKLKQSGVPGTFVARVPLHAPRAGGKPVLLGTVVTAGQETAFQFVSRVRPRRILIDPELTLLCQTQ